MKTAPQMTKATARQDKSPSRNHHHSSYSVNYTDQWTEVDIKELRRVNWLFIGILLYGFAIFFHDAGLI